MYKYLQSYMNYTWQQCTCIPPPHAEIWHVDFISHNYSLSTYTKCMSLPVYTDHEIIFTLTCHLDIGKIPPKQAQKWSVRNLM